jgi:hypothetical protein
MRSDPAFKGRLWISTMARVLASCDVRRLLGETHLSRRRVSAGVRDARCTRVYRVSMRCEGCSRRQAARSIPSGKVYLGGPLPWPGTIAKRSEPLNVYTVSSWLQCRRQWHLNESVEDR